MSVVALRLPWARITRTRRAALAVVWWLVFAVAAVLIARHEQAATADVALLDVYLPFVLPLVTFAIASAAVGGEGLLPAVRPLLRFGASPRTAALATASVGALACAVASAFAAALLVAVAHTAGDPPLGHDMLLSAYVGALAGAAHGAVFAFGSALTSGGGARSAVLVLDWLLGASPSWASAIVPYSHARSLLGGAPVVTLTEPQSAWCLLAIVVVSLALTVLRASLGGRA